MTSHPAKLLPDRLHLRAARILILFAAGISVLSLPAAAQDPGIEALSDKLVKIIEKAPLHYNGSQIVVVMDFSESGGQVTPLGIWLADRIAESLTRRAGGFQIFDRKKLRNAMEEQKQTSLALQEMESAARFGTALGANLVVLGSVSTKPDMNRLSVEVFRTSNQVKLGSGDWSVQNFKELKDRSEGSSRSQAYPKPGKDGTSYPACAYCPAPQYSQKARSKKVQGSVVLQVVITVEGRTDHISVIKSLSPDLDKKAIEAVEQWRFQPAKDPDGKPVAVQTDIEIVFRLLQ